MFRIIEVNGEKIELTANSATGLVYKQVFREELQSELVSLDLKELKKIKGKKAEEIGEKDQKRLLDLLEVVIKLGFVMVTMNKPFKDYWAKTTYNDYVEWRAEHESSMFTNEEFVAGVLGLYKDEQATTSTPKN